MSSPPFLPACSPPRRLGKLRTCFLLLFAGISVPLVAAFSHGRSVVPAQSRARPSANIIGVAPLPLHRDAKPSPMRPVGSLATSAANGNGESNEPKSERRPAVAAAALGLLAFASGAAVANAAKAAAAATSEAAVAPALVLPTVPRLALVCLLPTLLGYYKSEYGVSYGYGTAMAASSYLVLSSVADAAGLPLLPGIREAASLTSFHRAGILTSLSATLRNLRSLLPASLPAFHAFALFFYGTRLDLFLLYRELFLARFRAMRERIEERAKKQGSRIKRTPFLISCAFLYFCMMCPLLITSRTCEGMGMAFRGTATMRGLVPALEQSVRLSVVVALLGFLLGAFGDMNKTIGKALKGEDALITGGIFRFFRHPNYTGEVIGWAASCLAGFLAVAWKAASGGAGGLALWKSTAPYLLLSVMGAAGISFVLATATTGLEYRQKEKYGDTEEYQEWIKKSWVGFKMDSAKKEEGGDGEGESDEGEKS